MKNKKELVDQTNLAFEFLERLYLEVSFLIKEIEGMLAKEPEAFIIGRPSGYGITTRSSTGLDTSNVPLWLTRKMAVFFVPEGQTKIKSGQTHTSLENQLKVIYLRIVLNNPSLNEPCIYSGVLTCVPQADISDMKFENCMNIFEYYEANVFKNPLNIDFKYKDIGFKGKLIENQLYDLHTGEEIYERVLKPVLEMYRSEESQ